MTKTTGNFTDFLDFTRNSGGTSLRRIALGEEKLTTTTVSFDGTQADYASISLGFAPTAGTLYQVIVDATAGTSGKIQLNTNGDDSDYVLAGTKKIISLDNMYLTTASNVQAQSGGSGNKYVGSATFSVKEVTLDAPYGDLVLFNHPNNVPRVEYDTNGDVKGLLIEEARTNMIPLSEVTATDNQGWYDSSSVSTNLSENALGMFQGVSIASSGQNWHRRSIETASVTSGNDYAATVFYRAGTSNRIRIVFRNNAAAQESRVSGEIGSLASAGNQAGTVSILSEEDLPDNVKKITIKYTPNHSNVVGLSIGPDSNSSGETVIAYAAQFEAGPFATSFIPTTGATATRNADIAHIDVDNFGHNKKVGTMVVDFEFKFEEGGSGFPRAVGYGNSSNTNQRVLIFVNESTQGMSATVVTNNVTQAGHALQTSVTSPATGKVAFAFKDDDFAASRNGGTVLTDTAGDFDGNDDPRDVISIGGQTNNVGNNINGTIKSFQYYPRRLTNAQLQELTS